MALTDKLSAIGNAIRAKTGKTEKLTLDNMVNEINSISTGSGGSKDTFTTNAFGILPEHEAKVASSTFTLYFETSATGAVQEG